MDVHLYDIIKYIKKIKLCYAIMTTDIASKYRKYMVLKIFVEDYGEDNAALKKKYVDAAREHNWKVSNEEFIDAGFDLYTPSNTDDIRFVANETNKVDFKIKCSAQIITHSGNSYNTGFYMFPRSSISKGKLRLANSIGVIDAGYRGNLMSMFDVINNNGEDFWGARYDRYMQICAPSLMPIVIYIVNSIDDLGVKTSRDTGGFGSTGK